MPKRRCKKRKGESSQLEKISHAGSAKMYGKTNLLSVKL